MRYGLILAAFSLVSLYGADWFYLHGTQKSTGHTAWGFIQLKHEDNHANTIEKNGINKTAFAYVTPELQRQRSTNIQRARIGLRGGFGDQNVINYFLLSEIGTNGITNPLDNHFGPQFTDASITFRHFETLFNIRTGLFKYPGSEEGLQARFASPYILFTQMSNMLLLERFISSSEIPQDANGYYLAQPIRGVGAFRDSGIELFKTLPLNNTWSLSFAAMLGNGSGLSSSYDGRFTGYGYLALQRDFHKGNGYYSQALKLYGWYQYGLRSLNSAQGTHNYERIRYGGGLSYFKNRLRIEAEYTKAEGMIYAGAKDSDATPQQELWLFGIEAGRHNHSYGYYLSANYEFFPKTELFARYDVLHNLINDKAKRRELYSSTFGISYRFKGPTRIDLNYIFKEGKAPGNTNAQKIMDAMDNIFLAQFTWKF